MVKIGSAGNAAAAVFNRAEEAEPAPAQTPANPLTVKVNRRFLTLTIG